MRGRAKTFKTVCIGGTFSSFHQGHQDYLDLAFSLADNVIIGINNTEYAQHSKQYQVPLVDKRISVIKEYLAEKGWLVDAKIIVYSSQSDCNDLLPNETIECALVIDEYYEMARSLNLRRIELGIKEYHIHIKPRTMLEGADLSSSALIN